MRKVTYTCDRCGAEFVPEGYQEGVQTFTRKLGRVDVNSGERVMQYSNKTYLCPDCMKALKDWLGNETETE